MFNDLIVPGLAGGHYADGRRMIELSRSFDFQVITGQNLGPCHEECEGDDDEKVAHLQSGMTVSRGVFCSAF